MQASDLLSGLGYTSSGNCLRADQLEHAPDFGHVFRRAKESFELDAVYCLRSPSSIGKNESAKAIIPITYVCKAASFDAADEIHRLVWNQNIVPFLIVLAPQGVRVYAGFEHRSKSSRSGSGEYLVEAIVADAVEKLSAFSADSIDSGSIWDRWGDKIRPQQRVEWRLLEDLRKLELVMTKAGLTDSSLIHSLIGKFVYLYYLRHRKILSDQRLGEWGLSWDDVAGRSAKLASFTKLCDQLDEWLNGSIFPLNARALREIGATVIQRVAAVFAGDSPSGQMHLDFQAYDFSHIPIETLSVIYEQFLHLRDTQSGSTVGKEQAAYYTPIPVVNFIIDRMDEICPLRPGMRVLDAACGSGAFLVQCYRKLVEDRWRTAPQQKPLRPTELRELLVKHIYGMDVDGEACRVAELSLTLTLLDYVDPPDLTTTNFKLPSLSGTNIIESNAFDDTNTFVEQALSKGFDWIIGNPPWKDLKGQTSSDIDKPVLLWMRQHKEAKPTGGNQTAEAFAWRTADFAASHAITGLLMPAMTLFKSESQGFRRKFFATNPLVYVANFSNLAEVLFAGKPKTLGKHSRVPAAALIFRPGRIKDKDATKRIPVFSPLVANQEATRPRQSDKRMATWSIVVDEGEVRGLDSREVLTGDPLAWKLAAWGSHLDQKLLRRLGRLETLGKWAHDMGLTLSQGLELRGKPKQGGEAVEHHPELVGRSKLLTTELAGSDRHFVFPANAIATIDSNETYVRKGRYTLPESVCRPPHVLVSAARNWAIFSGDYLVVPARQIGIAGNAELATLLRALSLYLNSDFLQYHQFFVSTQFGVQRQVSTLGAFRSVPVPALFVRQDSTVIAELASMHDFLVSIDRSGQSSGDTNAYRTRKAAAVSKLNSVINDALGLRAAEAARVSDFVNIVLGLRDGKIEDRAVAAPNPQECRDYAGSLKYELDAFVGSDARATHAVQVWPGDRHGVIQIDLKPSKGTVSVHPRDSTGGIVGQVVELRRQLESRFSQWRYFNRNLRLFTKDHVYLFKPMQRFHWLRSQAVLDAGEVIGLVLDHAGESK